MLENGRYLDVEDCLGGNARFTFEVFCLFDEGMTLWDGGSVGIVDE